MTSYKVPFDLLRKPARRVSLQALCLGVSCLAFLMTSPSIAVMAQDAPAPAPAKPTAPAPDAVEETEEGEGEGEAGGKKVIDPRTKAANEAARQLRIERQTEITSSLPTESALLSSIAVPEGLVGNRGLRFGRFVLQPGLTLGAAFTDNADADENDRDEELSLNALGAIRAESVLVRHQFGFDATGTASHSFQEDNDDFFDWSIGADGLIDLTRKSAISSRVEYSLDTEDDSSAEAEDEANDVEAIKGDVGYQFDGNRLGYQINLGAERFDYSGNGSADRDNSTYQVNQRFSHRTTQRLILFASPQYSYTKFDEEVADDGEARDAHSATGLIGADFVFRSPMTLSAAVGYSRIFFDGSDNSDEDSLVASSTLSWQANPLTSFDISASHSLELSTVDDASSRTDSALQVSGNRQVGLDTSLKGELGASYGDFKDTNRNDIDLRAAIGIAHRLRENFFVSLAYQYDQRFSNEDGADFYENQALLGFSVLY